MEKIKQLRETLTFLMSLEWCMGILLITSYFDLYFNLKYSMSILDVFNDAENYLFNPIDYFLSFVLLSFIFAVVFPTLHAIYIILVPGIIYTLTRGKCGIIQTPYNYDIQRSSDFCSLEELRLKSAQENNQVLFEYCNKKEKLFDSEKNIKYFQWGIVLFIFMHYLLGVNGHPLYVEATILFYNLFENNKFIIIIFIIFLTGIVLSISSLFMIKSDQRIYYPKENKR